MTIEEQWQEAIDKFEPGYELGSTFYTQGGAKVELPKGCRWHGDGIFTVEGYILPHHGGLPIARRIAILQTIMEIAVRLFRF